MFNFIYMTDFGEVKFDFAKETPEMQYLYLDMRLWQSANDPPPDDDIPDAPPFPAKFKSFHAEMTRRAREEWEKA